MASFMRRSRPMPLASMNVSCARSTTIVASLWLAASMTARSRVGTVAISSSPIGVRRRSAPSRALETEKGSGEIVVLFPSEARNAPVCGEASRPKTRLSRALRGCKRGPDQRAGAGCWGGARRGLARRPRSIYVDQGSMICIMLGRAGLWASSLYVLDAECRRILRADRDHHDRIQCWRSRRPVL